MDEQLRDVLDLVRRTARQAGDTAADAAYGAGKKAEELLSVARVRARIAGLEGEVRSCLQDAGGLLYATHTGTPTDSDVLIAKLEEIDGLKARIQALREEEARLRGQESVPVCPTCGAPTQEGDLYCRTCGGKL